MKHIEIRNSFIAYCSPTALVPANAFACICSHIFCTIYESGVLAQGWVGEGVRVYGSKTSDRADKNAVYMYV